MGNQKDLVVKSNRLVEASYRLTLAEQRIILFAIVTARRTGQGLMADDFVEIQAADYAAMFEVPVKQAYEQIKEAAQILFNRYVVLHDTHPETGKPRVTKMRWLSTASYIDGAGIIQLRFAQDMVPHITRLEACFTRYQLEQVAGMSSAHAIRLYELLMQWGSTGQREIELAWLKRALQLEQEYPAIKDFKKWVIDVAVAQINAHTDLSVRYTQRKTGRAVTHFLFHFAPKAAAAPADPAEAPAESPPPGAESLFQRLRRHGIGAQLARRWIAADPARTQARLDYVEARAAQGLIHGSTAGYLRRLWDSGAEVEPSAFAAEQAAQRAAEAAASARAEAARRAEAAAARAAQDRAMAALHTLSPAQREDLAAEYRAGDGAARAASWNAERGDFSDPLERLPFQAWLRRRLA